MKNSSFLVRLFWLLMGVFFVGRVGFMLYNAELWPSASDPSVTSLAGDTWLKDIVVACFTGAASHDLITVAALCALPALLSLCGVQRLRLWLTPYYIIIGVIVGVIIVADAVMYEFWQFKLSSVVLAYAAYPEGTANSVSPAFVATRLGSGLALMALIIGGSIWVTPRRSTAVAPLRYRLITAVFTIIAVVAVAVPSGLGSVYTSERLFLNHAAVNPVLGFVSSVPLRDYADRYDYFEEDERAQLFEGLYAGNGASATDSAAPSSSVSADRAASALADSAARLLKTDRPDILVVFAESFGSEFVTSLGGARGTTPDGRTEDVDKELERLIPEGIWWTNYYSNSFRTDRGTVSAFCGWTAYTDVGLMTHTEYHDALSSLPKAMRRAGYDTSYLYPGAMTNMGKGTFLRNIGFEHLLDDTFFTPAELDSSWGASDSVSAQKVYRALATAPTVASQSPTVVPGRAPRLFCYQTVSSHEPWDVNYSRLTDKVQNAFAYTDHAIGALVDSLKASPAWDNLLVIIIPDHGHLYKVPCAAGDAAHSTTHRDTQSGALRRQAFDDPEFFHAPMLWLGGAIKEPRTMDVLMNQSDLCATLLGQLGIDHGAFPWSRDVLSPAYTYPFVYCAFPAGLLFRDATGTTVYDVTADRVIFNEDSSASPSASQDSDQRIRRAKAILQTSYDGL